MKESWPLPMINSSVTIWTQFKFKDSSFPNVTVAGFMNVWTTVACCFSERIKDHSEESGLICITWKLHGGMEAMTK